MHDHPFRSHAHINEFIDSDLWLTAINAASVLLHGTPKRKLSGGSDESTQTTSFIATSALPKCCKSIPVSILAWTVLYRIVQLIKIM